MITRNIGKIIEEALFEIQKNQIKMLPWNGHIY